MAAIASPIRAGTRFTALGSEYEIAAVDDGSVRYCSVIGGTSYVRPFTDMQEAIRSKDLQITYVAMARSKKAFREHVLRSAQELKIAAWRRAYLEPVIATFGWTWPVKAVKDKLAEIQSARTDLAPGYSTLAKWRDQARLSMKITALAPDFYLRGAGSTYSKEAWDLIDEMLEKHWLKRPPPSVADAWDLAKGELATQPKKLALFPKRKLPCLRTIQRRVTTYDPVRVALARFGASAARRMAKAAGASVETEDLLDLVYADGQLLDVLIIPSDGDQRPWTQTGLRPYMTVLLEHKTRNPYSILITFAPYSASTILMALRNAVVLDGSKPRGLMRRLKVDNGSDYISNGLKHAQAELGFALEWAGPADPNGKAAIERFIGTLTRYIHLLPGTTFCSPLKRGDYQSEKLACITIEQLNDYIDRFVQIYQTRLNYGTGRAPLKFWNELAKANPPITYELSELDHATRVPEGRLVSDGRVRVHNLFWYSHGLKTYEERCLARGAKPSVDVLIDEFNLHHVLVRTCEDNPTIYKTNSTRPRYTEGLTLFEHDKVSEELKRKGIEDLEDLEDYELERARFEMLVKLENDAATSRRKLKALARLQDIGKMKSRGQQSAPGSAPPTVVAPKVAKDSPPPVPPPSKGASRPDDTDVRSKIASIFGGPRQAIASDNAKQVKHG